MFAVDADMQQALTRARLEQPEVLEATEYAGRAAESASKPQKFLTGDDKELFAVKFRNNRHGDGRALAAEHLAGSLGLAIMAPVASVALIHVSQDLLDAQPEPIRLEDDNPAVAGIHHGSAWVNDCVGPLGPQHVDVNRELFAALHVLYTWLHCSNDQQFLYVAGTDTVLSVDHSPFLPDGPGGWTREALMRRISRPPTPSCRASDSSSATIRERS